MIPRLFSKFQNEKVVFLVKKLLEDIDYHDILKYESVWIGLAYLNNIWYPKSIAFIQNKNWLFDFRNVW